MKESKCGCGCGCVDGNLTIGEIFDSLSNQEMNQLVEMLSDAGKIEDTYIEVEVIPDIDDYISSLSDHETDQVVDLLIDLDIINKSNVPRYNSDSISGIEWAKMCDKLADIRLLMSNEDEEIIRDITRKY